jgi:GAF domain-containing protein/nitrogen-specific signal transduction histidine kinase
MSMLSGVSLGLTLLGGGLALALIVWLGLRLLQRSFRIVPRQTATASPVPDATDEGIVVIEPGGRVDFLNARARSWFEVAPQDDPHLDRLLRRVRPSDDFLDVCAQPGHKRLNLNGRPVEATSARVPGSYPRMLVSIRSLEFSPATEDGDSQASSSLIRIISDFSGAITANLDFESVVRSILDNTLRLIPADAIELKTWNQESRELATYRLVEANGRLPHAALTEQSQFGDLTTKVMATRLPVLLSESAAVLAESGARQIGINSYLAIPLIAGDELVGVLEAGQTGGNAFTPQEFELLRLIAPQITTALRNSIVYEQERRRTLEYSGLAGVAQAIGAIREPRELFARLVEAVAPLFDAGIVGFLLFDEARGKLEGQVPFRGLPPHIVQIYRAPVVPGSPAESLIQSRRMIVSDNAAEDPDCRLLGLTDFAMAASLRDTALIPLVSSGRMHGYLQLSHRQKPGAFSESERRLLQIVSGQLAAIIENALLVVQSRIQIARSESLGQLTAMSASAATVDDILQQGLGQLAALCSSDVAIACLFDEARGELRPHRMSAHGTPADWSGSTTSLAIDDPQFTRTAAGSRHPVTTARASLEAQLPEFYRLLFAGLDLESVMAVPLVARGRALGELILGSRTADKFFDIELQLLSTACASLASAMDRFALATQTDEGLRRRLDQLASVARVSRELGAIRPVGELLQVIRDETVQATSADCGSILLLDPERAVRDPRRLQSAGCPFGSELSPSEQRSLDNQLAFSIPDFDASPELRRPHEGVRSAMYVPITHAGQTIGLIQLHAGQVQAFDAGAMEIAQTLAVQAGVALTNARHLLEERRQSEWLQRRAATLEKFSATSQAQSPEMPLDEALTFVAQGIRESTPFRVVLISVYEPETGLLRRVAGAGIAPETLAELRARKQQLSSLQQLTKPEFRISRSYYIPASQTAVLLADIHYVYSTQYSDAEVKQNAWNPDDFLLLPLEDNDGNPLGVISLDDPSNGLRPDRATIESVELFAGQIGQIILNAQHTGVLNGRIESLSAGIGRQQQLLSVTQNDLPVLLRKDLEQTMALHALDRRAQRVRAGLAITESVSRQLDTSSALLALGRETLTQFGMTAALVAENSPDGPRLLHVLGNLPATLNIEALFGQRNPLRSSLQTGVPILVQNLEESEEWRETPLLGNLRAKGVISLPVLIDNQPVAAMMALSTDPLPILTEEDRQVYIQISRQASVVLQNISLLNETRRRLHEVNILLEFSRQLGGLDPGQIVEALLNSARHALSAAHAGAVLLWNDQSNVLEPRAASGYADDESLLRITYQSGEALPGVVFASGKPRRVDEIDFPRDYSLAPADLGLYRRATGGRLPVSSMLLPIVVEDRAIGLMVLDNFNTVGAFRAGDEALLLALSQQAALSLENVRLVHALTERAGQLQGLNEVATTLAGSLRSDQLVSALLDEVGRLLPFDTATLWLRDGDQLTVAAARGFADTEKRIGLSVNAADSALFKEMIANGQPLHVPDVRADDRFPRLEAPRLSWLGMPMLAKGRLTGVIAVEKWQASYYGDEQIQLGATLASQAAVALENASLYEGSVQHASELDERSQRLALLNRFSSSLAGLLDSEQVLALTAEQTQLAVHAERVTVVSFDGPQPAWVATSPASLQDLPQPLANAPLFARLRESLGAFLTEHADTEAELAPIRQLVGRNTRVLMVLPLVAGQELLALLFVSGTGTQSFPSAEVELARTIANQASIAVQNARSYQSTLRTAEQLSLLNQSSAELGTSLEPEDIYESIRRATARLMPVDAFVISLLDPEGQVVDAVYLMDRNHRLPGRRAPLGGGLGSSLISSGQALLLDDPQAIVELDGGSLADGPPVLSAVAVAMTVGNQVVGMLSARSHKANAYTQEDLRLLSTLANQAVATIQNGRLFAETQRLAQEFEQRVVERTTELRREQQNTETLLRILTEVSSSLDLDRALNRTLALLNESVRAEQGTIMLLSPDDDLLHYRAGFGYVSERGSSELRGFTLRVGEGLAGWVVQNREPALVDDLRQDPRWVTAAGSSREHRSAVVTPLMVADDVIGVLMVFSRDEAYFSGESLTLVKAIANQVAVAINNARLYELIRDQAERLGLMLRNQQEEASRSQAILESVADGVLVTNAENQISFVNTSIEHILGPETSGLVGQPLERFSALFGEPGQAWVSAIRRWADSPALYSAGDTYAERVELQNSRIALVHLAPVILEDDFLGTVSILRDITHEVEVDRLKSEFVATVSHELRTPMTAIKGYIEMLMMGAVGAVNENQAHFLEIVHNNINRLNTLVGDLLDVSRIESGKVTLAPEPVDMRQLAEDALAEIREKAEQEKKPISFTLQAPKSVPSVTADPERMRQVLRTLLDNAFHYTPENGAVALALRSVPRRSQIQIEVIDNGIGISEADQARVFERFFRGENPLVLATPGTGLGLSIARQLVEMHGGIMSVQSDGIEGHGSTFSFTLPVRKTADPEAGEPSADRPKRKSASRAKSGAGARSK